MRSRVQYSTTTFSHYTRWSVSLEIAAIAFRNRIQETETLSDSRLLHNSVVLIDRQHQQQQQLAISKGLNRGAPLLAAGRSVFADSAFAPASWASVRPARALIQRTRCFLARASGERPPLKIDQHAMGLEHKSLSSWALDANARASSNETTTSTSTSTSTSSSSQSSEGCPSESCARLLFLPEAWNASAEAPFLAHAWRAALSIAALLYVFLGVSLISDHLLSAIEVIASMERQVPVRLPTGRIVSISIPVWNQTVAHLTLISWPPPRPKSWYCTCITHATHDAGFGDARALDRRASSSSNCEFLLSINGAQITLLEVTTKQMVVGELGPYTTIGSGTYSLFITIALYVITVGAPSTFLLNACLYE